jgi:hypothetical protein
MHWGDVPAAFVAVELAEEECFTAQDAAAYLEGFNGRMLQRSRGRWAVAVPVAVRYDGDVAPGQKVRLEP